MWSRCENGKLIWISETDEDLYVDDNIIERQFRKEGISVFSKYEVYDWFKDKLNGCKVNHKTIKDNLDTMRHVKYDFDDMRRSCFGCDIGGLMFYTSDKLMVVHNTIYSSYTRADKGLILEIYKNLYVCHSCYTKHKRIDHSMCF